MNKHDKAEYLSDEELAQVSGGDRVRKENVKYDVKPHEPQEVKESSYYDEREPVPHLAQNRNPAFDA